MILAQVIDFVLDEERVHKLPAATQNLPAARLQLAHVPPLLPNTHFVSQQSSALDTLSPCRERQAGRASHEQRSNNEEEATNQRGLLAD